MHARAQMRVQISNSTWHENIKCDNHLELEFISDFFGAVIFFSMHFFFSVLYIVIALDSQHFTRARFRRCRRRRCHWYMYCELSIRGLFFLSMTRKTLIRFHGLQLLWAARAHANALTQTQTLAELYGSFIHFLYFNLLFKSFPFIFFVLFCSISILFVGGLFFFSSICVLSLISKICIYICPIYVFMAWHGIKNSVTLLHSQTYDFSYNKSNFKMCNLYLNYLQNAIVFLIFPFLLT